MTSISYRDIESILKEEQPFLNTNYSVVHEKTVPTYQNRLEPSEAVEGLVLRHDQEDKPFQILFPDASNVVHRLGERTVYTEVKGNEIAIKEYSDLGIETAGDQIETNYETQGLKTPEQEAEMLEKARKLGLDVATPLRVNASTEGTYLIKDAGDPETGEVPYWLTDLQYTGITGSDIESHLAESMEKTMEQMLTLRDEGYIHRSITPLSHRGNDGFSVYQGFNYLRHFSPEVNISPTGELKDFEHVESTDTVPERFADPVAETALAYLWTASECGLGADDASSVVTAPVSELATDFEVGVPRQTEVKAVYEDLQNLLAGGRMDTSSIRELASTIAQDNNVQTRTMSQGSGIFATTGSSNGGITASSTSGSSNPLSSYSSKSKNYEILKNSVDSYKENIYKDLKNDLKY